MTDTHRAIAMAESVAPTSIMHPLVAKMIEKNPTPEALEKLLKLQSDWEAAEAKRAYTSALVELKKSLPPYLLRDKTVDFTGSSGKRTYYTHTSLAGAMETVTPMLSEHGFSLTWRPGNNAKGMVTVTAKLTHRQGYFEESTLEAAPDTTGNKSGPQAVASAVTLLARYACLGMLGLATKDMVDPVAQPAAAPREDNVDTGRNMRALADLVKSGKTKAAVEKFVGKSVNAWTTADLDKLRKWIDAPAPAVDAAPETISKDEVANLKALMLKYKLTPEQIGGIIEAELGRHPENATHITKAEYQRIIALFDKVASGAFNLKAGKIVRPPAPAGVGPGVEMDTYNGKSVAQLEQEATEEDLPL